MKTMGLDKLKPPQSVSADGRELWDWAGRLAQHVNLMDTRRELVRWIAEHENRCGSCRHWMTKSCPREKHNNKIGRSEGPSLSDLACDRYQITTSSAESLEIKRAELLAVEARMGA